MPILEEDTSRACLFCQETDGGAYVPLHLITVGGSSAESDVAMPLVTEGAAGTLRTTQRRRETRPVAYTESLESHRGCGRCWLQWETHQVHLAADAGEDLDLAVHCPVCDLPVDIRRAYDAMLCRPCQRVVVARGGGWRLALVWIRARCSQARRAFGVAMLCLVFGVQALCSLLLWDFCEQQLATALGVGTDAHFVPTANVGGRVSLHNETSSADTAMAALVG